MAQKNINIGSSANKGDGEPLRTAFNKINENFTELYNTVIGDSKGSIFGDDSTTLVDAVNSSINLAGTVKGDIIPDTNVAYDIGSATKRFKDLYLSGNTINLGGTTLSITAGKLQVGGTDVGSTISFSELTNKPTTVAGYGITDAASVGAVNGLLKADGAGNISQAVAGTDYITAETSHADVVVDGDFTSSGFMKTDGAGNYSVDSAQYLSAITLGQVTGVDINDPQDNQVLSYNAGTGDWRNADLNWGNITGTPTTLSGYGITNVELGGTLTFPDATVQSTAWTGSAPGFTYSELGGSSEIGVTADVFDFGTSNTIDMQGNSVLFGSASIQDFAPGNVYANSGQYLYITGKYSGGSATNVAFTYDTNINNTRQTFYGKTEFGNNGQAPIVDFTGTTIENWTDPDVVNEHGSSAVITVGIQTATMDDLTVRLAENTPGEIDVEFNYDAGATAGVSANGDVANRFSGTTTLAAGNTTWTTMNVLTTVGDKGEFTIVDHSFHKIYRVTTFAKALPSPGTLGDAYCVIERLK